MTTRNPLHEVSAGLQARLEGKLAGTRVAHRHPGAKGDASEVDWVRFLKDHLPDRYRADKATVIDSTGATSDQIDVVVYDRQYTPLLYNQAGQIYVPAEAVYAVAEVKQTLSKGHIEYAGLKGASVRKLHRSSAPIRHAGGEYAPQALHHIPVGILCYESAWHPPFGEAFCSALGDLTADHRLDFGCALKHGAFEVGYAASSPELQAATTGFPLLEFLLSLLRRLQSIGTVPAIVYDQYLSAIRATSD